MLVLQRDSIRKLEVKKVLDQVFLFYLTKSDETYLLTVHRSCLTVFILDGFVLLLAAFANDRPKDRQTKAGVDGLVIARLKCLELFASFRYNTKIR